MIPPPSFGKKWIFFHFLLDSIFSEYRETLAGYRSVGSWGWEGSCFSLQQNNFNLRDRYVWEPQLSCASGRDTGPRGIVLNPFLGCVCLTCGGRAPSPTEGKKSLGPSRGLHAVDSALATFSGQPFWCLNTAREQLLVPGGSDTILGMEPGRMPP